ncbi:ATP-binding protein [Angustibacter luteus]|uniref:ATP-binding protein n=1 Tax=Angustibacter luteus TaxID=658456 RepID=A0ABW1JDE4_9ACTN
MATRIPTRTRTLRVPHAFASVPRTRRTVVEDLRGRDVPSAVVDEVEIVVTELLGNAVQHAAALPDGTVRVHWQVKGGVVELDVTDGGGSTTPRAQQPTVYATRGRGLRIVRSLAHEWGVLDEDRGRTVWVCLGGPSRRRRP